MHSVFAEQERSLEYCTEHAVTQDFLSALRSHIGFDVQSATDVMLQTGEQLYAFACHWQS